ncbi:hypothetical protein EON66_00205 [archaeon]|nr:MAG: hypothetical protein EON66_00205 [archaeon]
MRAPVLQDTSISAFSHTHMVGPGVSDLGNHGIMVTRTFSAATIQDSSSKFGYSSRFSHGNETALPGYYAVFLEDANTFAELTATGSHSGMHQYTCGGGDVAPCTLLLDVCHTASAPGACLKASTSVQFDPTNHANAVLTGSVLNHGSLSGRGPLGGLYVYLYATVSASGGNGTVVPLVVGTWVNNTLSSAMNATTTSGNAGSYITYAAQSSDTIITVRAGLSFVSVANAKANLFAQQSAAGSGSAPLVSFNDAVAAAQAEWEGMLSRVHVDLPLDVPAEEAAGNLTSFYSAVYRTFLAPTQYSEADGSYMGFDGVQHTVWQGGRFLSDMSIWDIHRTQTPWLVVTAPDVAADVTHSLLVMTEQGGHLPRWPLANIYADCMVRAGFVRSLRHSN